jgi:hypothetical protein
MLLHAVKISWIFERIVPLVIEDAAGPRPRRAG